MTIARPLREPLAFGEASAVICQSRPEAAQGAARLIPGLVDLEFLRDKDCYFETASTCVNGLRLAAFSATASRLTLKAQSEAFIILPLSGSLLMLADGKAFHARAQQKALLVPGGLSNQIEASDRSLARIRIDADRLQETTLVMLGGHIEAGGPSTLHRPQELGLSHGVASFDAAFRSLFALINSYQGNQSLLDASGVDDALYRTLAIALSPEVFARQKETPPTNKGRQMKAVCDYVIDNLGGRVTLTDLERVGCMSRRTLHNAFFRAFGVSPMEWVRHKRLIRAQSLLSNPRNFQSVTEVLFACGFTNASLFSAHYRRRFGETPSQTITSAQRTRH